MEHDVIIVGAGPAGSTAARFCAKKGLKTLLVEKNRLPRYKPCGGCLSPRVLRELDFDTGEVIESTISEAKFTFQLKDPFSIVSQNPIGYLVMRDSFDHLLCRKAQEGGADLYEGRRVVGFQQDAEGVDVSTNWGESLRCRYLVGADGAGSIVAQSLHRGMMKKAGMALEGEGCLVSGIRKRDLFQDLTVALKLAKAIYRFPSLAYNVLKSNKNLGLLYLYILAGNAHYRAFSREMIEGIRRRLGKNYGHDRNVFSFRAKSGHSLYPWE